MKRHLIVAAFLAVATVGFIAANPVEAGPAPDPGTAAYEIGFLQEMTHHHDMAIEMSQLCLGRATRSEVREMCQGIITSQGAEVAKMQGYARVWSGPATVFSMMTMDMSMMADMDALRKLTGPAFDKMFLEHMVIHHQMAVRMSEECGRKAHHAELTSLCRGIITEQSNEIAVMREWLRR